jgi:hypothetical protein
VVITRKLLYKRAYDSSEENSVKTDLTQWSLQIISVSREEFQTFIGTIPAKEREVVGGLKAWSAKDEIAHLTFWLETFAKNIKSLRQDKPLISTKNYLAMNDSAWEKRKDLSWAEVEANLAKTLTDIDKQVKMLSVEELTNGKTFSLESWGRPLIKSLLYELVDHPLHHFVKLYKRFGQDRKAREMLKRITRTLIQPGVAKWTATSRSKIQKHEAHLK